ncbi:hypothetical protein [Embleya scabrispora]|uniref:hypothetical protein n=1 Tax=Embleya scabrispora TaxID=159449 RepID=UPI001F273B40|nr:hypothetical protein [Embleya scabrispora]
MARTPQGRELTRSLTFKEGASQRRLPMGLPLCLRAGLRGELDAFVAAYHRMIETILRAWDHDPRLRRVLTVPEPLRGEIAAARDHRVHVMRLDLLPHPDGGLRVLETNANCPGGFMTAGRGRAAWRPLLTRHGIALPPSLPTDTPTWPGTWLTDLARRHTGIRPRTIALLCPRGANRNELEDYEAGLTAIGLRVLHADPRDLHIAPDDTVVAAGTSIRHAYAKISTRDLLDMGADAFPYLRAVRERALFVQNGIRGRFLGDNKLCLAVLSDPQFADLFPAADHRRVHPTIPWSRNIALCDDADLRAIARDRERYVLKRPLDTRGRGVLIGRETPPAQWTAAVEHALESAWLVQEYVPTARPPATPPDSNLRHDLCLGAVDGKLVTAVTRAGRDERLNVALSARPHPVYL